jgi:hypothetical protein
MWTFKNNVKLFDNFLRNCQGQWTIYFIMLGPYDARCFNEMEKRKVVQFVEFFPCSNIINSWQIWVNEVPT